MRSDVAVTSEAGNVGYHACMISPPSLFYPADVLAKGQFMPEGVTVSQNQRAEEEDGLMAHLATKGSHIPNDENRILLFFVYCSLETEVLQQWKCGFYFYF